MQRSRKNINYLTGASVETDAVGAVVQSLSYHPYGSERVDDRAGRYRSIHTYTDKEKDIDTGLFDYGARHYDPTAKRFLSLDPWAGDIRNPQTLNEYSYVVNNPIRYIDPTGAFIVDTGEIEKGDNLTQITQQINTYWGTQYTVQQIADLNGIVNPDIIYPGNFLIPNIGVPDISIILGGMMQENAAAYSGIEGVGGLFATWQFFENVRNGGAWDLKNTAAFNSKIYSNGFVFYGEKIANDAPGNIHYGYVGAAFLPPDILLEAAGSAQQAAGTSQPEWNDCCYGDDPQDSSNIMKGVNMLLNDFDFWNK